jgi:PHD/YefM family antitoxin component YafN of YafNO toxin-antitoxin module
MESGIELGGGEPMPTAAKQPVQYVSDADGKPVSVIVPIELWREIESERETAYLLKSKSMRKRLLEAKARKKGMSLEEVRAQLGI